MHLSVSESLINMLF